VLQNIDISGVKNVKEVVTWRSQVMKSLTSSEPSIRRDAWREINISLTRRREKSKRGIVRTREARVHHLIVAIRSEEGSEPSDLKHQEFPIREIPMRSGPSDRGRLKTVDLWRGDIDISDIREGR
jgi:hypothetical protein